MSATADALKLPPPPKAAARRGFPGIRCWECGESGSLGVALHDTSLVVCSTCGVPFTAADRRRHLDKLAALDRFIAAVCSLAPEVEAR